MTIIRAKAAKPKVQPTSFSADEDLLSRIDAEMWTRKTHSRSEVIRRLIEEGLHRADRLRAKGKSPDLTEASQ